MQRFILLFNFLLFLFVSQVVQAQQVMSLDQCIQYALDNNPQVKIAQLQVSEADARIKESTSTGLPQVSAELSYNGFIQRSGLPSGALSFGGGGGGEIPDIVNQQFTSGQVDALGAFLGSAFASDPDAKTYFSPVHSIGGSVTASQLIFSNSYLIAKKAARYYSTYVNDQLAVTRRTLRNQVIDAYLPALLLSENVATLDKNAGNLEKILRDTRAINVAGFAEQLDVDRLELSLATLKSERGNLVRQQEIVIKALQLTMGMPIETQVTLSDNVERLMTQYADADLTSALDYMNRPEYVALLKGRELSMLQLQLYDRPWMPTVAGFLQWQGNYQGGFGSKESASFNNWYFIPSAVGGLTVSSKLWDSGTNKAQKQRAQIAVLTIDEQKKLAENGYQLELDIARKQYLNAQERVSNQQKSLDLAQRIYDTTQKKYAAGIGSSFEVTQAEQELYTAQQAVMTARYDLLTARVAIRKALGN